MAQHKLDRGRLGNVLMLGAGGGVGTALLSLLARHPLGFDLGRHINQIFLADGAAPPPPELVPRNGIVLSPEWVRSRSDFITLFRRHRIEQVIELAEVDTLDGVSAADECGVDYLCTGFEVRPEVQDEPGAIPCAPMLRAREMLPENRPRLLNGSFLVGSGMNPGVVNALVEHAIEEFVLLSGAWDLESLELGAIYFTERDSARATGNERSKAYTFPMTWSPAHCLWEILEPLTGSMRGGNVHMHDHPPHQRLYEVRCGSDLIEGMVVPHEEVVTIGARYPWVESAYVYRLPPAAHDAIRAEPSRSYDDWVLRKLYPPETEGVEGVDRVGVLLCSRRYGELWMGYETDSRQAAPYRTNATLLQVAAGVLSGWRQLGERAGLHFVEELDSRRFLDSTNSILGPPSIVYDPEAVYRPLELRQVAATVGSQRPSDHSEAVERLRRTVQASVASAAT